MSWSQKSVKDRVAKVGVLRLRVPHPGKIEVRNPAGGVIETFRTWKALCEALPRLRAAV